ncbi:mitochondrial import receptor subunit TOM40 homolog 1-like [Prorops nasuta]|uniref:mitochondrial import receptor subunit TOM40 homolog 1-like n=1 Tax=Prorops nasuta TaxID=863751 RepID=UPI0034CE944D
MNIRLEETVDMENNTAFLTSNCHKLDNCIPCPESRDRKPGNPGSFEDLHKKVKDIYPVNFEGAKLMMKKVLSNHFNVTHNITLSSVTPSGYKFGASYIGNKAVGLNEKYPVIKGDMTPNGYLSANLMHTLGCRLRVKLSTQIAKDACKAFSTTMEYRSDDFTAGITLADPNIIEQHGTLVLHYLQSITSRIALGAEIACIRGSQIPGGQQTLMCGALRYNTGPSTLSATLGQAGLHVCYYRKESRQLQLGVELNTDMRTHESTGTIVYQLDLPQADLVFRGIINSKTTIGGEFEKKLYPLPDSSLVISGLLNRAKQQFKVGIGLNIG